jgi:hypothetical protein
MAAASQIVRLFNMVVCQSSLMTILRSVKTRRWICCDTSNIVAAYHSGWSFDMAGSQMQNLWEVPLPWKEQSNMKLLMNKLYYLRPMKFSVEKFPSLTFVLTYRCILTRPVKFYQIRISRRIRSQIQNGFRSWNRGPGGFDWWKKNRGRISPATVSLNEVEGTVNCLVVRIKYKF